MNAVVVILSILFITSIGYAVLRGFNFLSTKNNLFAIGASYGLGVGCISMQLYLYSRLSIPWQKETLLIPWIILFIVLLLKNRKKIHVGFPKFHALKLLDKILLISILLTVAYVIFEALMRPVVAWDAWANWLMQAKAFFITGGIRPDLLMYMDSQYPLTINLLGTFIYLMLGGIDDTAVLLTSSAFYIFLSITFFAALRKRYSIRYALFFTFLLVTTQNLIRHGGRLEAGLADLPLGYFAFLSVLFLFEYFKKSTVKTLLIFTIFLSITSLIKFEGVFLSSFIALCAIVHIIRHKFYNHLFILGLWIVPLLLWQVDRKIMNLTGNYSTSHGIEFSIQKSINAFLGTIKELLNIKSWNFVWIVYIYSLFAFGIKRDKALFVLNAIILSQFALYMFVYNFTAWHNPESSIERLLVHIVPLVFYNLAIMLHMQIEKY